MRDSTILFRNGFENRLNCERIFLVKGLESYARELEEDPINVEGIRYRSYMAREIPDGCIFTILDRFKTHAHAERLVFSIAELVRQAEESRIEAKYSEGYIRGRVAILASGVNEDAERLIQGWSQTRDRSRMNALSFMESMQLNGFYASRYM